MFGTLDPEDDGVVFFAAFLEKLGALLEEGSTAFERGQNFIMAVRLSSVYYRSDSHWRWGRHEQSDD